MSADFLALVGRSEHPNYRDFGSLPRTRKAHILIKLGIISGWRGLVVINAVQSKSYKFHDAGRWRCQMFIFRFPEQYEAIRLPDDATFIPQRHAFRVVWLRMACAPQKSSSARDCTRTSDAKARDVTLAQIGVFQSKLSFIEQPSSRWTCILCDLRRSTTP